MSLCSVCTAYIYRPGHCNASTNFFFFIYYFFFMLNKTLAYCCKAHALVSLPVLSGNGVPGVAK